MNHPSSRCYQSFEELVEISRRGNTLRRQQNKRSRHPNTARPSHPPQDNSHPDNDYMDVDVPMRSDTPDPAMPLSASASYISGQYAERFIGAARTFGKGNTFMNAFDTDPHSEKRKDNLFYPFAGRQEWQLASFLLRSSLGMSAVDMFLSLDLVKDMQLLFRTSADLRSQAEMLPAGPQWQCKPWTTVHPIKTSVDLFYRHPLDTLQSILGSPLVQDALQFTPLRIFRTAEKIVRVYSEWMTSDAAWDIQQQLPNGATQLGTILSSDKTNISAMTGNWVAYPLLISLANLQMDFRMKSSHHGFVLLAILPVAKFIEKDDKICGVLHSRLIHECIDFVVQPLKKAAEIGVMMSDPLGYRRYCFTPLVSCIVYSPESALYAGVAGKTSSVTMASVKQFGDLYQHEPRTASTTLAQLLVLESKAHPWDLPNYIHEAKTFRLNGVHHPFWRDWPLARPHFFLTPEPLHHWHKMFWDHDARWCINAVGAAEMDFRFSVLQPRVGFRHFKEGISKLKQVTGREHRNVQRYIIAVIAGAVPKDFLIAVRALLDFHYFGQAREIDEDGCQRILASLQEFHNHKSAITDIGARQGAKKNPIDNWYIPKLEFMQSVVPNIRANGPPIQFSADVTEHSHITEIKNPARASNNQSYESQIVRHLDRLDKCRRFDLATSIREACLELDDDLARNITAGPTGTNTRHVVTTASLLSKIQPVNTIDLVTTHADYFEEAANLLKVVNNPLPRRTFVAGTTAFHLTRDPTFKQMSVSDVATKFGLPNLQQALADFVDDARRQAPIHSVGGRRRAAPNCFLPFRKLQVWSSIRIQAKARHRSNEVLPAQTINAAPPDSEQWPLGRYDSVLVSTDPNSVWPPTNSQNVLNGHCVAQVRLILRPVPLNDTPQTFKFLGGSFLAYVQRFDVVPQLNPTFSTTRHGPYPDPASGMYLLKCSARANGTQMGDIIPVEQIRAPLELVPCFGQKANPRLTKANSMETSETFWLDKYFDKETFYIFEE